MRRLILSILFLILFTGALMNVSCNKQTNAVPPIAKIEPKIDTVFGEELVDNYFWLRDRENSEVINYLNAENAYTETMTAQTKALQETLFTEMKNRIKETDLSVPYRIGDYLYYDRTEEGKQYKIYCRKKGSLTADEEITLDLNLLAEGHDYLSLGTYEVSPDHKLLAYSTDYSGREIYTLQIKNLTTGELLPDSIESVSGDLQWANDNKTFFYSRYDETLRPYELYRHTLGSSNDSDKLLFTENDGKYWLSISKTKSHKFLLLMLESKETTEIHYLSADKPAGSFELIHTRQPKLEYYVENLGDQFFIRTNDQAQNFKLMVAPVSNPVKANWTDFRPYDEKIMITGMDMFKDFIAVYERKDGLRQVHIYNFGDNSDYYIEFDEAAFTVYGDDNYEFNSEVLRFGYMSMLTPRSYFDFNMASKERELLKRTEVLGGFDPDQYQTERIFATADDGAKVPISLIYKKGITKNGNNPLYLMGYGSYGSNMDPYFSSNRISLLDRGFIYAVANVRGGGEMGRQWYEDGKYLKKKNTFTDFIACAEHLVALKYTNSDKLVATGGSAGGLLMGAIANMRADLFHTIVADVPFVDVVNTMLDETIPLTVMEYEEWGNPNIEEYFRYMLSYSPYDNVTAKDYCNLLITAGLNDPRVQYWEPAKWTAKLRANKTDHNKLILKTNMGAGHGGASGRYDYLKEIAFEYAFILDILKMTN